MKQKNAKKEHSTLSVLDTDYISKIKKEFEEITGVADDDEAQPTTLEYIESINDYFLKYPNKL